MAVKPISRSHLASLRPLERTLKDACTRHDIVQAEATLKEIHALLADYGVKHPRMLEARLWYFESLLDSNHVSVAESGFVSIREKSPVGGRLRIEATFLLSVALLRQRKTSDAKAHFRSVLKNLNKISSSKTRRLLQRRIFERFEEEAILTELIGANEGPLIPEEIHNAAILLLKNKSEEELYEYLASAVPAKSVYLLDDVRNNGLLQLSSGDRLFLPAPNQATSPFGLGRRVGALLKRIGWRTVCDTKSPIYQMWATKVPEIYSLTYFATAISQAFSNYQIGIPLLAAGVTAIVMKSSAAEFCEWAKPEPIMKARRKGEPNKAVKNGP
ncbi:MAG: hypothetical protein WAO00_13110 [Chthoniobacterales bacterium]